MRKNKVTRFNALCCIKKIFARCNAALLIILLVFSAMAGCGDVPKAYVPEMAAYQRTDAVSLPGTGDNKINVSVGLDGFVSAADGVGSVISNRLNINLVPIDADVSDPAQLEALASSGILPDVLRVSVNESYFPRWIEEGLIRSLPAELLEKHERLRALTGQSREFSAVAKIHGGGLWFIPVADAEPYLQADSARIYYRKDWLAEAGMEPPDSLESFTAMLAAFNRREETNAGLSLAGGVTYLLTLFGADPESWVMENGEWVPAYYSRKMLPGLRYVRSLYTSGALDPEYAYTKASGAVGKLAAGESGALIRHGDPYWLNRVLTAFAEENGVSVAQTLNNYIGVLPPPAVSNESDLLSESDEDSDSQPKGGAVRAWPRAVEYGGCVVSASVNNERLERILTLLAYTLSDEGQELAYFGVRGETCAAAGDGTVRLFIDADTGIPVDVAERYPASRVLFILDRSRMRLGEADTSIPSDITPAVKTFCFESAAAYNPFAVEEGDGLLARFIHTPAKDALVRDIDASAGLNAIVTGTAPVEEMFAVFQAECEEKNIREAIREMNARINEIDV